MSLSTWFPSGGYSSSGSPQLDPSCPQRPAGSAWKRSFEGWGTEWREGGGPQKPPPGPLHVCRPVSSCTCSGRGILVSWLLALETLPNILVFFFLRAAYSLTGVPCFLLCGMMLFPLLCRERVALRAVFYFPPAVASPNCCFLSWLSETRLLGTPRAAQRRCPVLLCPRPAFPSSSRASGSSTGESPQNFSKCPAITVHSRRWAPVHELQFPPLFEVSPAPLAPMAEGPVTAGCPLAPWRDGDRVTGGGQKEPSPRTESHPCCQSSRTASFRGFRFSGLVLARVRVEPEQRGALLSHGGFQQKQAGSFQECAAASLLSSGSAAELDVGGSSPTVSLGRAPPSRALVSQGSPGT